MQTKTTLALALAIILHVTMSAQINLNNKTVLAVRVNKPAHMQLTNETGKVARLNEEIKSYDEQIAELQKQKQTLNTKINDLFESRPATKIEVRSENSLSSMEEKIKQSVLQYMDNTKTLKKLLKELSDRSVVTDAVADDLAKACKLAQSSQYMKEEAYALSTDQSKMNMLANSLEKMEQARMQQELVINLLEEPSGPSVLCLNKK